MNGFSRPIPPFRCCLMFPGVWAGLSSNCRQKAHRSCKEETGVLNARPYPLPASVLPQRLCVGAHLLYLAPHDVVIGQRCLGAEITNPSPEQVRLCRMVDTNFTHRSRREHKRRLAALTGLHRRTRAASHTSSASRSGSWRTSAPASRERRTASRRHTPSLPTSSRSTSTGAAPSAS